MIPYPAKFSQPVDGMAHLARNWNGLTVRDYGTSSPSVQSEISTFDSRQMKNCAVIRRAKSEPIRCSSAISDNSPDRYRIDCQRSQRSGRRLMAPIFEDSFGECGPSSKDLPPPQLFSKRNSFDGSSLYSEPCRQNSGEWSKVEDGSPFRNGKIRSPHKDSPSRLAYGRYNRLKARSKRRRPHLRCPVCQRVWASDWAGLCSHSAAVHDINLDEWPTIRLLLEQRSQKMQDMYVNVQRRLGQNGTESSNEEFQDSFRSVSELDTSFDPSAIFCQTSSANETTENSHRGRNFRSMSDAGGRSTRDCELKEGSFFFFLIRRILNLVELSSVQSHKWSISNIEMSVQFPQVT